MSKFLDILKGEGEAVEFIKAAIEKGQEATEILEAVKKAGLGIRPTTATNIINYVKEGILPARPYVSYLGLDKLPTLDKLPKSVTSQLRNFAYHTVMTGFDNNTGEKTERHITISSNQLLTKQQALDYATAIAEGDSNSGGIGEASGTVVDVFQNNAGLTF